MNKKTLLGLAIGGSIIIGAGFYFVPDYLVKQEETSLSLQGNSPKIGDVFSVSVILSTKKEVAGVDAFIEYDPTFLEVVDVPTGDSVFDDYPGVLKKDGLVAFSATIKGGGTLFSGLGTVGAVDFKALKEGTTTLTLQHVKGNTLDSNVATADGDVLDSVKNLNLTISSTTPKGK